MVKLCVTAALDGAEDGAVEGAFEGAVVATAVALGVGTVAAPVTGDTGSEEPPPPQALSRVAARTATYLLRVLTVWPPLSRARGRMERRAP
jgi:hypothetical protein